MKAEMVVFGLGLETLAETVLGMPIGPHLRKEQPGLEVQKAMEALIAAER
jgi:hypothetical protein